MMSKVKNSKPFPAKENCESESGTNSAGDSYLPYLMSWSHVLRHEITKKGLIYRAKALVYTTLLSLAPLLAVSFSVLKAFGVHNQLKPFLSEILHPLGEQGAELGNHIVGFVENIQVGVLGSVGIVFLIYSVISLLEIIKDSFNNIWRTAETRVWTRRVSDFLSIVLIGPVLVFSALGVMASMKNSDWVQKIIAMEPLGTIYYMIGILIPYVLIISAFTFVYMFMPSTRVKFSSALIGGIAGGLAWKTVGWIFATFIVKSASYNAIYSGFAIIILFMFWLYISWVVLLLGGVISYYHQHPDFLHYQGKYPKLSQRQRDSLGFFLMYLIGTSYYEGKAPWSVVSLADAVSLPWETVLEILNVLEKCGLLVSLHSEPASFLPSRAPETLELLEIYRALQSFGERQSLPMHCFHYSGRVGELIAQIEQSACAVLNGLTLRDLVLGKQ